MMTYEQMQTEYEVRYERAKTEVLCFCICGHEAPGQLDATLGTPLPCDDCFKAGRSKAEKGQHGRVPPPAQMYALMEAERERNEAEAYVRAMGNRGLRFIAGLYEGVMSGKRLTDVQVGEVMRSKEAEQRTAERQARREAEVKPVGFDPLRVYIPETVEAGDYAVEGEGQLVHIRIERPEDGPMRGFVIVSMLIGEGVTRQGVQRPQPHREVPGYRQWYQGHLPHLVARLVANPTRARERFVEAA